MKFGTEFEVKFLPDFREICAEFTPKFHLRGKNLTKFAQILPICQILR